MELRVSGAQIPITADIDANLSTIARALEFASSEGADVLLTPEGSLSGYTHQFDVDAAGKALEEVTALARECGVALALGTCFVEADDGKCYNQIRFYDGGGDFLGFHSKISRFNGRFPDKRTEETPAFGIFYAALPHAPPGGDLGYW